MRAGSVPELSLRYAVSGHEPPRDRALSVGYVCITWTAAQEGRRNPPDRSREQGVEVPRAWGPAIVPELRSRATRDVPMGGGKPKDSRGDQDSDDRHTRPF
jgi:hypothetical protein